MNKHEASFERPGEDISQQFVSANEKTGFIRLFAVVMLF
jgi:hypothetical protein